MMEPVLNRDYVVVPTYDELRERIEKAKEILEAAKPFNGASIFDIDAALKALEGK